MRLYNTALEAKVGERNTTHLALITIYPQIIAALKPQIGNKILNQGHVKSDKFRKTLPEFPHTTDLDVWIESNKYGLTLRVKTSGVYKDRHGEHHCACYAEATWHVADIIDGYSLGRLNEDTPKLRTDYTVDGVTSAREEVRQAKDALSTAESKLYCFGEHDNG